MQVNSNRLVRIFERLEGDHGLPQVLRSEGLTGMKYRWGARSAIQPTAPHG